MKTTIDVADDLFERLRAIARRDGESMRTVIEEGLRMALAAREARAPAARFAMPTFGGTGAAAGLTPEFDGASWERVRDAIHER